VLVHETPSGSSYEEFVMDGFTVKPSCSIRRESRISTRIAAWVRRDDSVFAEQRLFLFA
jgi:hypothetical protein